MIAIDVNLLLYAYNVSAPEHPRARAWLEKTFASELAIGLPLVSVLAFVRLTTDRRVTQVSKKAKEAADIVGSWLDRENVCILEPGARHWQIFFAALADSNNLGAGTTDAHLAALAIEHGATLCTNDRDFRRFENLAVRFPLLDEV